jgi:hypothetical protein
MISAKIKIKTAGTRLLFYASLFLFFNARAGLEFHPGEVWRDVNGQPIQAHGGGILVHSNVYYWYGEDRTPGIRSAVSCYSSTNLYDWKREGVALWQTNLPRYYDSPTFVERPKVIFNPRTKKFVMWMHAEQAGYHYACAGIATSDTPAGPFVFLKTIRPVTNDFEFPADDPGGQKQFGATTRDLNIFADDDGRAYVFYAGEDNWTMYVVRLNDEFTGPETPAVENKTFARILVRTHREAPAPFKANGRYYLITSACTGWAPNGADCAVAQNILGPYGSQGNPCVGTNADITFGTQSTFVLPAPNQPGKFIFMADEWRPQNLSDSRYIWLPLISKGDGAFTLPWRDRWDLSVFK